MARGPVQVSNTDLDVRDSLLASIFTGRESQLIASSAVLDIDGPGSTPEDRDPVKILEDLNQQALGA